MTEQIRLDGAWYPKGTGPGHLHFCPTGLPAALCGVVTGSFAGASSRSEDYCSECGDARIRIELEMNEGK